MLKESVVMESKGGSSILVYGGVAVVSAVIGVLLTLVVTKLTTAEDKALSPLVSSFGLSEVKPESYVARVGEYYISTERFNKEYMFVIETLSGGDPSKKNLYLSDPNTKRTYLDTMINELAIVIEAYNQGFLSSPDWEILSKISLRKSVVDGFLAKKIDPSEVSVSEKEVEEFYDKNRKFFRESNIPAEKAEEMIRTQIRAQKIQRKIAEYVQKVRDKLSIEKVEDNIK